MPTPPDDDSRLKFRAFLSHSTDAAELNVALFEIFSDIADLSFEVDRSPGNLNVTHLERRLRDCDAMIGIYPFSGEQAASVAEKRAATAYFRLELELAARSRKPAAVFCDRRLQGVLGGNQDNVHYFDPHQITSANTAAVTRMSDFFERFCDRLRGHVQAQAHGFRTDRDSFSFGHLLPRVTHGGDGTEPGAGYSEAAVDAIISAIEEQTGATAVDLGWPPVADAELYRKLQSLEFAIVDVGSRAATSGVLGVLHSWFVPSVRLLQADAPLTAEEWAAGEGPARLYGCLEKGYYKDIVYWSDEATLPEQVRSRVDVALKEPAVDERVTNLEEAHRYFMVAGRRHQVFLSYAGPDRVLVEQVASQLRKYYPTVFDYRDGESLEAGTKWREEVKTTIEDADAAVLFHSQAYMDSEYCDWEAGLLIDQRMDRDLPIFPVILPDAQARALPAGLEQLQGLRLPSVDEAPAVSAKLVEAIAKSSLKSGAD